MLWIAKHTLTARKNNWFHEFILQLFVFCCWIFTISDMNSWMPYYDVLTFSLQPISAYGQEIHVSRHLSSIWVETWIMSKRGINILTKGIAILSSTADVGIYFVNYFWEIKGCSIHSFHMMSLMHQQKKDCEVSDK